MDFNSTTILHQPIFLFGLKIGILFALVLYIAFLFVVLRQVVSMNNLVKQYKVSPMLYMLTITGIISAVFIFLLGIAIL